MQQFIDTWENLFTFSSKKCVITGGIFIANLYISIPEEASTMEDRDSDLPFCCWCMTGNEMTSPGGWTLLCLLLRSNPVEARAIAVIIVNTVEAVEQIGGGNTQADPTSCPKPLRRKDVYNPVYWMCRKCKLHLYVNFKCLAPAPCF
jgi:hypothetical protein